jgi:hypothetical protein
MGISVRGDAELRLISRQGLQETVNRKLSSGTDGFAAAALDGGALYRTAGPTQGDRSERSDCQCPQLPRRHAARLPGRCEGPRREQSRYVTVRASAAGSKAIAMR